MGEIAADYYEGRCCNECMGYFPDPAFPKPVDGGEIHLYTHGYPVICKDCWSKMNGKERAEARENGLSRALVETV